MAGSRKITCRRCGKCCFTDFIAYATEEDLFRWQRENRQNILAVIESEHAVWAGDHLISSATGGYINHCPFITCDGKFFSCTIYETRPEVCRNYEPGSSELCPQFNVKKRNKRESI
ncbi:MAG: YkgJ family cysteine cluster protein [Smithellaceae bacterium]|nr:YkgJ family cysteine cluster protein [Smithellaceae bacterium]